VFSVRYEVNLYIMWLYFSVEVACDMAQAVIHQPLTMEVLYIKLKLSLANYSVCSLQEELIYIQFVPHTVWTFSQLPLAD